MLIRTIDTYIDDLDPVAERSDEATFYHSRVWIESLAATFSHLSFRSLVSYDGSTVTGFLPYFIIRRGPFHTTWSLPFGTYGGPAVLVEEAVSSLIAHYTRQVPAAGTLSVGWIDYHNLGPVAGTGGWKKTEASTHQIDISNGYEKLWDYTLDRQRRKRARRAERMGVRVRRARSDGDLAKYYEIYTDRIDQWGGGYQYPKRLFVNLLERGGESVRLYVAEHDGDIVGGHFNFYYKDTVTAWTGVTSRESNHLQAGTLLYIQCLRDACEEGFRTYNLGGSLDKQTLIDFKESLGGTPHEYFQYTRRSFLGRAASWIKRVGGR
ncbi:MAG: GNAT family N-acetyltransferase [Candidatus Latescibacterota bacterium]|jgi:CelD/BcsL family acetyltransferase involved in cellulose biosynthesis